MFACNECDRKYATQNSLRRHIHSHRRTKRHVCPTCKVVFYRGDLLSRHLKLHQAPKAPQEGATSDGIQRDACSPITRRRCHTACLRCRNLRSKCSGQQPCATCVENGLQCEYSARAHRVSYQMEHPPQMEHGGLDTRLEEHCNRTDDEEDSQSEDDSHGQNEDDEDEDEGAMLQYNEDTLAGNTNDPHSSFAHLSQTGSQPLASASALPTLHVFDTQSALIPKPSQPQYFHTGEDSINYSHNTVFDSDAQQGAMSLDTGNQIPSAIDPESYSEDALRTLDHFFGNAASWPLLHESLFLSNPPHPVFRELDFSASGTNEHTEIGPATDQLPVQGDFFTFRAPSLNRQFLTGLDNDLPVSAVGNRGNAPQLVMHESSSDRAQCAGDLDPSLGSQAHQTHPEDSQKAHEVSTVQNKIINELVSYASSPVPTDQRSDPSAYWQFMSPRIRFAFQLNSSSKDSTSSALQSFVDLYFRHFGPLWPLISLQDLDLDSMHPLLYLVLTSIGAMYGGLGASNYGAAMHSSVRIPLTMAIELNDSDGDFFWLAQARLLTQVTALYFGQSRAFSYSQHLGALLVAQARRMELFSATRAEIANRKFQDSRGATTDGDRLSIWLQSEARRRLAFGIFRGATYLSVLTHMKPLVLMEEIDLEFPMCDAVWRSKPMPPGICLQMIEHDQSPNTGLRASDVYRIAMERNETLPPLNATSHELLLFGLQWPLWQFSRDQKMFGRLTGQSLRSLCLQEIMVSPSSVGRPSSSARSRAVLSEAESLDRPSRQMEDLQAECSQFVMALQKWERALPLVKTLVQTDMDRSSLLSSLILYHLGYLRLNAPVETLHQIQYRLADNRPLEKAMVEEVRCWANSPPARVAAEKACTIWSLIARESAAAKNHRARFNLLAFTGLHHSAVLLWTFAGAHQSTVDVLSPSLVLEPPLHTDIPIPISKSESSRMLGSFVQLYDLISPARWSSFARAADVLRRREFPSGW